MRKLFLILIVLLILPGVSFAERLVCDIPTDAQYIVATKVLIDGAEVPGVMDPGPVIRIWTDENGVDWMVLLDESAMAAIEPGRHTFEANAQDISGWWGDWATPLDAGKPGTLGNVKVAN